MLVSANIFQPLIDVFEAVIKFFHVSLGVPWGWAIVLLTVCVRVVLIPLTIKQLGSMQRMQQLQPQMKEIQRKYKEDKQRQQQEMMKFYKENNVNPLGSCLPLALQLPVFISLYYMLRRNLRDDICHERQVAFQHAYALKHHVSLHEAASQTIACGPGHHASFLFIGDLTATATGLTLVILLILYVGSQLGSSLLMSSPTMDPTQRKLMLFMPLIFVLFIIRFPSGLLVYWITTNLWTVAQQFVIKKRIGPMTPAVAAAGEEGAAATGDGGVPRGAGAARPSPPPRPSSAKTAKPAAGDGAGSGGGLAGGLGGLLRGRKDEEEATRVGTATRAGPPPRPPRKKKKRSGRRR